MGQEGAVLGSISILFGIGGGGVGAFGDSCLVFGNALGGFIRMYKDL